MVEHATQQRGFNRLVLLLEETGWGESNKKTMTIAVQKYSMGPEGIFWFNWGIKERGARMILRAIHATGADDILLVANASEAKVFSRARLSLEKSKTMVQEFQKNIETVSLNLFYHETSRSGHGAWFEYFL